MQITKQSQQRFLKRKFIGEAEDISDKLSTLDAHYLTQYPRKMSRKEYLARRKKLKDQYERLKKKYRKIIPK